MRAIIGQISALVVLVATPALAGTIFQPTLKIAAEERYDDDPLLRTDTGTGQMISKVSPQIGFDLKTHTFDWETWYAADLFLMHESGFANVDHRGRIHFKGHTSQRNLLEGTAQVWRVTDPTSLPRVGMAVAPSPILYGKAELADSVFLTRQTDLKAAYKFEGAQIYEQGKPPGFVHTPWLEYWYHLSERTSFGPQYRFQYFSFGPEGDHSNGLFGAYRYRISPFTTLTAVAGPVLFQRSYDPHGTGIAPRATVDVERDAGPFGLAFQIGHDIVGASGFSAAMWADFVSITSTYQLDPRWRVFGGANYFRNGRAPSDNWVAPFAGNLYVAQGYAAGAGLEWKPYRVLAFQATANRIQQVAGNAENGADLVRDIVALGAVITAL